MERKGKLPLSRSEEEVEESRLEQGHEAARQRLQWGAARSRWQQGSWAATGGVGRCGAATGILGEFSSSSLEASVYQQKGEKEKKRKKSHKV